MMLYIPTPALPVGNVANTSNKPTVIVTANPFFFFFLRKVKNLLGWWINYLFQIAKTKNREATYRGSSFSAQDAITPLHFSISNCCLKLYWFSKSHIFNLWINSEALNRACSPNMFVIMDLWKRAWVEEGDLELYLKPHSDISLKKTLESRHIKSSAVIGTNLDNSWFNTL